MRELWFVLLGLMFLGNAVWADGLTVTGGGEVEALCFQYDETMLSAEAATPETKPKVEYSVKGISYAWTAEGDITIISGSDTQAITVKAAAAAPGLYHGTVTCTAVITYVHEDDPSNVYSDPPVTGSCDMTFFLYALTDVNGPDEIELEETAEYTATIAPTTAPANSDTMEWYATPETYISHENVAGNGLSATYKGVMVDEENPDNSIDMVCCRFNFNDGRDAIDKDVKVIGQSIKELKYKREQDDNFIVASEGETIYVQKGTLVCYQVTKKVERLDWPMDEPAWNTGETGIDSITKTYNTVTEEGATPEEVKATCNGKSKSLNVIVYDVTVEVKCKAGNGSFSSTADIIAGGLDSDPHKADVRIKTISLPSGTEVKVSLTGAGDGYEKSAWWGSVDRVRSEISIGGGLFEFGGQTPITLTTSSESITGTLTSSNKRESTTVKVEIPSLKISKTVEVNFVECDFEVSIMDCDSIMFNVWSYYVATQKIPGQPNISVEGHDLRVIISEVTYVDESTGALVTVDATASNSLSEYVELDPGAIYNHDYFRGAVGAQGLKSMLKVASNSVVNFKIKAYDFNVW